MLGSEMKDSLLLIVTAVIALARESAFMCKFSKPQFPWGECERVRWYLPMKKRNAPVRSLGAWIRANGQQASLRFVLERDIIFISWTVNIPVLSCRGRPYHLCLSRLFIIQTSLRRWSGTKSSSTSFARHAETGEIRGKFFSTSSKQRLDLSE